VEVFAVTTFNGFLLKPTDLYEYISKSQRMQRGGDLKNF